MSIDPCGSPLLRNQDKLTSLPKWTHSRLLLSIIHSRNRVLQQGMILVSFSSRPYCQPMTGLQALSWSLDFLWNSASMSVTRAKLGCNNCFQARIRLVLWRSLTRQETHSLEDDKFLQFVGSAEEWYRSIASLVIGQLTHFEYGHD